MKTHRQTQREDSHMKTEAEIEVMQLKPKNTKDCYQPTEARKKQVRILPWDFQKVADFENTFISNF